MNSETPDLKTIIDDIHRVQEQMRTYGQDALKKAFKAFFDVCPEVQAVTWTQYAPYFNDGDACVFHVNEYSVVPYPNKISPDLATHLDYDPEDEEVEDLPNYGEGCMVSVHWESDSSWGMPRAMNEQEQRVYDAWQNVAPAFNEEDLFERVFGSDCRVVATREGFDIQEYDHD